MRENDYIAPRLYDEYGVNRGLRDDRGVGVLTGLTNISKIVSSKVQDGKKVPCDGELWYRGYRVENLIGSLGEDELGFEKVAYLLLMGELPNAEEQHEFEGSSVGFVHCHRIYKRCYHEGTDRGYHEFHDT